MLGSAHGMSRFGDRAPMGRPRVETVYRGQVWDNVPMRLHDTSAPTKPGDAL